MKEGLPFAPLHVWKRPGARPGRRNWRSDDPDHHQHGERLAGPRRLRILSASAAQPAPSSPREEAVLSDRLLVRRCLAGDEEAWADLVAKYKNLVFSIAIRKGIPHDEAADLFQSVWVQVFSKLSTLRKRGSIRSWLITVTVNQCYHWNQKRNRRFLRETDIELEDGDPRLAIEPDDPVEREEELLVQRALARLNPRCQELIRLLFYTHPPKPYKQVAAQLGLAIGSIGFIRGRCLKKLQSQLDVEGLE